MKTKFKFLAMMLMGILLSTNVWGETTYTLVTAVGDLTDGDKVVIATKGTGSAIGTSGVTGGTEANGSSTKYDATVATTGWMVFTVEDAAQTGWKLKNDAGQYVGNPTDNTFYLTKSSQAIGTCFVNSDGVFGCNGNRFLQKNSGNIRMYALNNSYTKYYLFKSSDSPAFTLTVQSNNESYGTVSRSGMTINCTPADGYYVQSASSSSSAITPSVDGNTVTLTGTLTENTTITVTFAPKPQVDVYLSEAGTLTKVSGTFYLNDSYTLPSITTGECDGKTFIGWSTEDIPMPGDKPTENYYGKGANVTLAATNTFYAVYAEDTGGSTGAPEGTTLWGENFTHFGTNTPSAAGTGTGTTIYGSATIVYDQGSTSTKAYDADLAGGTAPELLLTKNNYQWWSIAGIKTGEAKEMTLTYKTNNETLVNITVDEDDKIDVAQDGTDKTKWTLTVKDGETIDNFTLNFWNTSTGSNIRLDDIVLVVSQTGASYSNYTTCGSKYSVTFKNQESVISTDEYTAGTVIYAPATAENTCGDGFFFVGWLAQPLYVGATPNPKPTGLIQPNGEITVPAEDVVYYAVFAQKRIN